MPIYEYNCADCGPFTQLRSITECSTNSACPACGSSAVKIFPLVSLRPMRSENRTAWERNEQSAHAPHVCSSHCGHKPKINGAKERGKPVLEFSKKRNRRPWMLGH